MPRTNTLVTFFVEKKMVYLLGKFGLFIGEIVLNNENLKHQKLFLFKLEKKKSELAATISASCAINTNFLG